jgi:hypothetical protein
MGLGEAIGRQTERTRQLEESLLYCRMRAEEILNWRIEGDKDRAEIQARASHIVDECNRALNNESC